MPQVNHWTPARPHQIACFIEIPREERSGVPFTAEQLTAYAALR